MDTMLARLEFATAYLDNILLRSENNEEHKKHIKAVLQKTDKYGFKLASEKCEFFMKQQTYLGNIIDKNTRRSDSKRTKASKDIPLPIIITTFSKCMILELH